MVFCTQCEEEIEEEEVQKCEHCEKDGLGNCCIGYMDHECTHSGGDDDDLVGAEI